jgi:hypothetical protein
MTTDDLRAIAQRTVEKMMLEHPDEAAVLASLVLSEILALGLFGGGEGEVAAFADAVKGKLGEIALAPRRTDRGGVQRSRASSHASAGPGIP